MFGYMTDLDYVSVEQCFVIQAQGEDLESLLFHFLDELLYLFSVEPYLVCKKLDITRFDLNGFMIDCRCYGESFDLAKHPQGTEVKAITYSAMQINQQPDVFHYEVFVIIDI
ncbi:hypothetical protein KR018_001624 [Drosophila ironensis]|nr:hypothetical protein KR018_001624 [Drosophila ironensis]